MPTTLMIVYRVLGTLLFALAAAAIVEKYRTVRGAVLLPARVLECRRAASTNSSRGASGYRYLVELHANGQRLEMETNDAFWFKHDKERIQKRMEARELKSSPDFADWNAGRIPVALIHPASAGHGLNLQQGGSILIWFGLTWSLELYQQTNARLWRQGQQSCTVIIQHIVAKGTIDERILKVLEHKDGTQAALIDAVKADLGMTEPGNGGIL